MANISEDLAVLKDLKTDGAKARNAIVKIADNINTNGTSATTLNGKSADYFTLRSEFDYIMKPYEYRCGVVHDLREEKDVDGNYMPLTAHYSTVVYTGVSPEPTRAYEHVENKTQYLHPLLTEDFLNAAKNGFSNYTMTLPDANAIYQLLGYSEMSDLQEYIER